MSAKKLTGAKKSDMEKSQYIIKITLRDIEPPIWRRFQVPGNINLDKLHHIIQIVMGWEDRHLYQFIINHKVYGEPELEYGYEVKFANRTTLGQKIQKPNSEIVYEYDFGDSWVHNIVVEDILSSIKKVEPLCLEGERACPPEDCGGLWSYQDLLGSILDPYDKDHAQMVEWAGQDFNPEYFDIEKVNAVLKKIKV